MLIEYVPDDPDLFEAFEKLYDAIAARSIAQPSSKGLARLVEIEQMAQRVLSEHDFHEWTR